MITNRDTLLTFNSGSSHMPKVSTNSSSVSGLWVSLCASEKGVGSFSNSRGGK